MIRRFFGGLVPTLYGALMVLGAVNIGAAYGEGIAARPRVVLTSIKPLTLIANELGRGTGLVTETLLPPGSSPHHYALRISDAQKLKEADLVLWLGHDAEPYINQRSLRKHLPLLSRLPASRLIEGGEHHHHEGAGVDMHIWLDPELAGEIAQLLHKELLVLIPAEKSRLDLNLETFQRALESQDKKLAQDLAPYTKGSFLLYHDAYRYFFRRYGLQATGVIQAQPGEGGLSVRHMVELRRAVQPYGALCLFGEPQFAGAPVPDFGSEVKILRGELDPLGIEAKTYSDLLDGLALSLEACLGRAALEEAKKRELYR